MGLFKTNLIHVFCSLALAFSLLVALVSAQQQQPSSTTPRQDQEVIRISTELVQTDVTVVDKQGRFIDGLRPEQFELTVDGKLQPISFFEQVTAGSSREAALVAAGKRPPADASVASTAVTADRGRTTLFFVDDFHLSPDSMKRTRDTLLTFVNEIMGPKDQALIATASGQLNFLQQVTGNKEMLRKAIEGLTYRSFSAAGSASCNPPMSDYQAVAIENGDRDVLAYVVDLACPRCPADTGMSNNAVFDGGVARPRRGRGTSGTTISGTGNRGVTTTSAGPNPRAVIERAMRMCARAIARQAAQVTLNTLNSLESLIRTAAPILERKLVVLISDGFFINFVSSLNAYDIRRLTDAALRSGVVIYTVDAKGLVSGGPSAKTEGFDLKGRLPRMTMGEVKASQDALNALAADTGGQAWRNSNDLLPGVRRAVTETSTYYLLAWRPDVPQGKDRFRKIKARIKDRPDLMVRVRNGFFAEEPTVKESTAAAIKPKTTEENLLELIRAAYPIRSLPVVLSAGHMTVSGGGMAVAASMLVETDSLGTESNAAEVDVMGVLVNKTGHVVSSLQQHLTAPPSEAAAQRGRMVYTMQFPAPAPGLYQVRVAARESKTGRGGSATQWVEIPDISKGEFRLSSIFLSEVAASAAGADIQKASISPDRGFARASRLRFQAQIYNAALAAGRPDLTLELQLSNNVKSLIATPPSPVSTEGVTDLARVPLTGEFPLGVLPAGQYVMKITVTDRVAKKNITQQVDFRVQ